MNPQTIEKIRKRNGALALIALTMVNGLVMRANAQVVLAPAEKQNEKQNPVQKQNPFDQGTRRVVLTEQEKQLLMVYADNSKALLEKAKEKARGEGFEAANETYKKAMIEVVLKSYEDQSRSELLMRYALTEALELTTGKPAADGNSLISPGVLKDISNQDLLTVILEESIDMALSYYRDYDRPAIAKGSLVNLPYMSFALKHLEMARVWQTSITEQKYVYAFGIKALEHFTSAAANSEQTSKANFAEELLTVDQVLDEMQASNPKDDQDLAKRVRKLRYVERKIAEAVADKLQQIRANSQGDAKKTSPVTATSLAQGDLPSLINAVSLGMTFVLIHSKNQTFKMGSSRKEQRLMKDFDDDETQHKVKFTDDFEMQTTDVTQEQWQKKNGNESFIF